MADAPREFRTDGCSLYSDRDAKADWCDCCVAHDLSYWRGGTAAERERSDAEFAACVRQATGNPEQAARMHAAVRLGGAPWWPTPFRWGYGWAYGRGYQALSLTEQIQTDRLQGLAEQQGQMQCPSRAR
ncbi:hypothetical protein [Inhella inkyongensis]|uniref:hypothetical protein n=1 Tax=Inhella inkyongensis TaxID=392593 RepID=UPI001C86384D|nr:hypothetical protein [Inhella inkyongensis]